MEGLCFGHLGSSRPGARSAGGKRTLGEGSVFVDLQGQGDGGKLMESTGMKRSKS